MSVVYSYCTGTVALVVIFASLQVSELYVGIYVGSWRSVLYRTVLVQSYSYSYLLPTLRYDQVRPTTNYLLPTTYYCTYYLLPTTYNCTYYSTTFYQLPTTVPTTYSTT